MAAWTLTCCTPDPLALQPVSPASHISCTLGFPAPRFPSTTDPQHHRCPAPWILCTPDPQHPRSPTPRAALHPGPPHARSPLSRAPWHPGSPTPRIPYTPASRAPQHSPATTNSSESTTPRASSPRNSLATFMLRPQPRRGAGPSSSAPPRGSGRGVTQPGPARPHVLRRPPPGRGPARQRVTRGSPPPGESPLGSGRGLRGGAGSGGICRQQRRAGRNGGAPATRGAGR